VGSVLWSATVPVLAFKYTAKAMPLICDSQLATRLKWFVKVLLGSLSPQLFLAWTGVVIAALSAFSHREANKKGVSCGF
jgi:hypothetical protein